MRISVNRPWRVLCIGLLVVAVALVGCAAPAAPSPTAAPAKPAAAATGAPAAAATSAPAAAKPAAYKIGHFVPLTGSQAEFGTSFAETAKMAVEEVNAKGGVDGVKLEMVTEDHMGDPKQGLTAFNKLVQVDKVPLIVGAWSTVIMATAPVADQNQVVLINYGANAVTVRGSGKFVFSTFPLADLDIKVLADYVYDKLSARKGAVLYINNDTGRSNAETFKAAFEAKGGKILAYESHQPEAMDFGAQLAKIKAADPDVVHIPSLIQEMPRIVKQAREMGIKAQFTSYSVAEGQQLLDQGGDAADGLIYTFLAPPETKPEVKEFYDRWKAKFGKVPPGSSYNMYVWDTLTTVVPAVIKYAAQKGYGFTGEGLRKAFTEVKEFDTKVTGRTIFQFPGQDVKKPVTLKKVNAKEKKFDTLTVIEPQ